MAIDIPPEDRAMERIAKAARLEREHEARLQAALDHYANVGLDATRVARNLGETDLAWIQKELDRRRA